MLDSCIAWQPFVAPGTPLAGLVALRSVSGAPGLCHVRHGQVGGLRH